MIVKWIVQTDIAIGVQKKESISEETDRVRLHRGGGI